MMESHANMAKLEFLNSFFTERLLAVAGEIFQVVKDTIIDYQEEIDRAKQENHHLKEMLMEKCINDGSGHHRNIQAVHEAADFSQTPDSESSIIKVKLELCTVQQDAEPREFLCNSPSPVCNGAPQHFSVKTISDEKEADVPSNNSGVAVKVEPPDSRVICSDNSGCDMQGEGVPDNPAVDLQDRCRLHPKKAPTPQQGQTRWNMPNTYTWPSQDTRQGQDVLHHTNAVDRTEALREMDLKITYLTSLVESLVGGRRILSPQQVQDEEEMNVFPLNSMEALEDLEKRLLDNGLKQRMTNTLSLSGGHTIKKTIWRIASKVFTQNLAKSLNWCGRGHKRGLKQTACGQLIIAAAVKNPALPAPTEAEAEKCLKDYLRLAPARR